MDIIWGLDAAAQKEKIYLEYPQKGLIESFVIQEGRIVQTYRYVKQPAPSPKFAFMYSRLTATGEKDSEHMALKTPLVTPRGTVYLISQNIKDHTTTLYYRFR
jgi:cytochrome b involved in lipid metabolism